MKTTVMDSRKSIWEPVEGYIEPYVFKTDHIYLVDVSWRPNNPIHRAILHVGFIDSSGTISDCSEIWSSNYEEAEKAVSAHYLKIVKDLGPLD